MWQSTGAAAHAVLFLLLLFLTHGQSRSTGSSAHLRVRAQRWGRSVFKLPPLALPSLETPLPPQTNSMGTRTPGAEPETIHPPPVKYPQPKAYAPAWPPPRRSNQTTPDRRLRYCSPKKTCRTSRQASQNILHPRQHQQVPGLQHGLLPSWAPDSAAG